MARYERDRDGIVESWEVEVEGTVLWTREGRFWRRPDGTVAGGDLDWVNQPIRGLFRGIDKERARVIDQHLGNGFALVDESALGVASDPAIEARLVDLPSDDPLWTVYSDWLQQHGDARGAWGAVCDGGNNADAALAARLQSQAERELRLHLGLDHGPSFGWQRGLLAWCSAEPAQLDSLLLHPLGRTLADARVRMPGRGFGRNDMRELAEILGRYPHLRRLQLCDFEMHEDAELSDVILGELGPLWPRLTELRHLVLQGGLMHLGQLDLPSLQTLTIRTTGLMPESLEAVVRKRPSLTGLELWFGRETDAGSHLGPLLSGRHFPSLRALGLCNADFTDELVAELHTSPLLPRLRTLDLSRGTLSDEGLDSLLRSRAAYAHLDLFDLSQSCLSPEGVIAAAVLCKQVIVSDQKGVNERYVSVAE